MYSAVGVRADRTMPKLVRNSSAVSRSGARSRPYARSVTLISAIVVFLPFSPSAKRRPARATLAMLDHQPIPEQDAGSLLLAEIGLTDPRILREVDGRPLGDDLSLLENVRARRDGEGLHDVLLDQQHRHA